MARLTLLLAYRQLRDLGPVYQGRYDGLLKDVAPSEKDNPVVLSMLARKILQDATPDSREQAAQILLQAIQLGSAWPPDYGLLARLFEELGHYSEAANVLERGIASSPYTRELYSLLGACYQSMGKKQEAIETLRRGLQLFPEELGMRNLLEKIQANAAGPLSNSLARQTGPRPH